MLHRRGHVPSLASLTWLFLRVGNTTFGGGYASIAALQRELVEREGWITHDDFASRFRSAASRRGPTSSLFARPRGGEFWECRAPSGPCSARRFPSAALAVLITQGYESGRSNAAAMAALGATRPPWSA